MPHEMAERAKRWRTQNRQRQSDVARAIGVALNTYRMFEAGRTKKMHPESMQKLEQLLQEDRAGFVRIKSARPPVLEILAAELRLLSELLLSDMPDHLKARRFRHLIESYAESMDEYTRAIADLT